MTIAAPKERPITFSAPMVREILEGRKTRTMRAMRVQPAPESGIVYSEDEPWHVFVRDCEDRHHHVRCPYGRPGDRLWVREKRRMPRDVARIILEITAVRIQCVCSVAEFEALAEGAPSLEAFRGLWDGDPLCWVVEFRVVDTLGART